MFVGPGDVVYEGMMSSSIDDGGLEFRGTEATLKINRSGMSIFHENVKGDSPIKKFEDGVFTTSRLPMGRFEVRV